MAKLHAAPVTMPNIIEAQMSMNPELGVAATRPAIVPEQKPTIAHRGLAP